MPDSKFEILIIRLLANSREGKIGWESTASSGVYQAAFPNYSVRVLARTNAEYNQDYGLEIYDQEGQVIEQVWDTDLDDSSFPSRRNYQRLKELYSLARRRALGVDRALDDILQALGGSPDDEVSF